ncbi:MAG: succinate--CoA ligase subunit alpha [SAR202 cluster bacterium]|nr:succinate--CoA ligase subunit alpha [SAR202 cluster bacterium]|tara:strand:- start:1569 stop:2459 length:891 start_codon:yes stop_codon:yes gene_type:complete
MSILLNKDSRVIIQGMTGREGTIHAERCIEFGTTIVGGVTPGRGGTTHLDRPIFDSVAESVNKEGANTSLIFVPAAFATDAILESADAGIDLIVCITDGLPTLDMVKVKTYLQNTKTRLIGPNCPGLTSPGEQAKAGIIPNNIHEFGRVGVVSRSGTLTYEATVQLTRRGIGQSTCVGIGGDPIVGTRFTDILELFEEDSETDAVVLIGEIGGTAEQEAADFIRDRMEKPVTGFIAGATAPPGRRMGHAGAIITGAQGTADAKKEALRNAGCYVSETPGDIGATVETMLQDKGITK